MDEATNACGELVVGIFKLDLCWFMLITSFYYYNVEEGFEFGFI